jgi:ribonuclease-3
MATTTKQLEERLQMTFTNRALLDEALTHRSYLNEHPEWKAAHNERLEFLGDAVLELVTTEHLFTEFPEQSEGRLTNLRAALVRTETLAKVGEALELYGLLRLSRGEARERGRAREQILANAVEALIGAVYLDQGFTVAQRVVQQHVLTLLPEVIAEDAVRDAKSRFQEEAQGRLGVTPHYKVLDEWGPDHQRKFRIGAFLGEELAGEGQGASKQDAQQAAAAAALEQRGWLGE